MTLVNEAADRLRDAGVAQPEKVLAPLLRAALENALRLGDDALTGPVSRGDAGTVERHLARLAATAPESVARVPGAGPAYRRPGDRRRPAAAGGRGVAARRAGRPVRDAGSVRRRNDRSSCTPAPSWPRRGTR